MSQRPSLLGLVASSVVVVTATAWTETDERPGALDAARGAARWLRSVAVETELGLTWPSHPGVGSGAPTTLYHGSAGGVLFLLELAELDGDDALRDDAYRAADFLARAIDADAIASTGLYTGLTGVGYVLGEAADVSDSALHRSAALEVLERVLGRAHVADAGASWGDVTDVIGGTAGIGLYLLDAARRFDREDAIDMASRAGERLLAIAEETSAGHRWRMNPTFPRIMPNFSHGTAGVAYFLARLAEETGDARFLDAAIAGAEHLLSIARDDGLICHHTPGGEDLYYLGWCHGPVGTARLYAILSTSTDDPRWTRELDRVGEALLSSGFPARQPGYWNNVGICCGAAGVAVFALERFASTSDRRYLELAETLADDVVSRATVDGDRWSWPQAEHRVRPEELAAQTGYMQGAAGVGLMLVRLERARRGDFGWRRLPDSPWGRRAPR